ncbi:pellicle/biofilm biosynthesis outer membrane protein PelC [soil metagenome]
MEYNKGEIMISYRVGLILGFITLFLVGCVATQVNTSHPILLPRSIAVLPFNNVTETPQADARAAAMVTALMYSRGFAAITYPISSTKAALIPGVIPPPPRAQLLNWARERNIPYAVTGSVTEWRYKVGLDGEPVVGITLEVINVETGEIVWTSVGSQSGGSRTAVSTIAQRLLIKMLFNFNCR